MTGVQTCALPICFPVTIRIRPFSKDGCFPVTIVSPVIIGGSVVSANVIDPGFGFTEIPDVEINSETGIGAAFLPVLKFKKIGELTKPLDPAKVITVIDCISR